MSKKASGGVILVDLCFNRIVLTATLKLDSKETRTEARKLGSYWNNSGKR